MYCRKDGKENQALNSKERADTMLVRLGHFPSREKAQAAIMAGQVFAGKRMIRKPSETVQPEEELKIHHSETEYVSRGAWKLD